MQVRLLLGPAGSGKTFRCLAEIRSALLAQPDGAPLLLLAPKQATYELERQLLADPSLQGYTRLHVLSFERLARFILEQMSRPVLQMLNEEGRLMVLRGLLAKNRGRLKLFRASARLNGFAQQLSLVLRELQRHKLTPESLNELAARVQAVGGLAYKLQDLATLLQEYLLWLKARNLQDADCLLTSATHALAEGLTSAAGRVTSGKRRVPQGQLLFSFGPGGDSSPSTRDPRPATLLIAGLWVDGFVEWAPQEMELLATLLPHCQEATLTFCLDRVPTEKVSWLSSWGAARNTFDQCKARLAELATAEVSTILLERQPSQGRFAGSAALQHLERKWAESAVIAQESVVRSLSSDSGDVQSATSDFGLCTSDKSLRVVVCVNPEAEVILAAREVLRHVRAGGRYREASVLVRKLEGYHDLLQRIFTRYEIPFFLDRRESVAHHPLAEMTRSALRTVATDWMRDDWFAALKSGLVPAEDQEIDRLENEALAHGWKGAIWQKPITLPHEPELTRWLADLHQRIMPPFQRLALALAQWQNQPTGPQLAEALRELWTTLQVEQRLQQWAEAESGRSTTAFPTRDTQHATVYSESATPNSIHATVWQQMNDWLANLELAFPDVALKLRDWLPILDAGLAGLTVGVIPPALDQVLIGAVDRSRISDVKLAVVLGLNETVFPAPPQRTVLLTDLDRAELERRNIVLSANARVQLSRERYYAYVACTRARQRLVLTSALQDADGAPLNPSPFLAQVKRLFPSLSFETESETLDWRHSEHASELIRPLLKVSGLSSQRSIVKGPLSAASNDRPAATDRGLRTSDQFLGLPLLAALAERLGCLANPSGDESLSPELAAQLYGDSLRTSVSRIEQFAACPFRFFVHSGLRAEERQLFELDVKEQGTFQHDVLAFFHLELRRAGKQWRDLTPQEARERIAKIARGLLASYRDGLLQSSEETRFTARVLTESLQDFVETQVEWLRGQYQFDPVAVELPFGEDAVSPVYEMDLGEGHRLALQGRIDRVDLCTLPGGHEAWCVVVDYKSSQKRLDPLLMTHGLQLQLPAYLEVLRHWPNPRDLFGADRLVPAGVFYVNLRGRFDSEPNRRRALANPDRARKLAYRHTGRFDQRALGKLDARKDAGAGDQFNYRLNQDGRVGRTGHEALTTGEFTALLDSVGANLKRMGRQIYAGVAMVAPYRKGSATACDNCGYRSICRIDPWTHTFRVLRRED